MPKCEMEVHSDLKTTHNEENTSSIGGYVYEVSIKRKFWEQLCCWVMTRHSPIIQLRQLFQCISHGGGDGLFPAVRSPDCRDR